MHVPHYLRGAVIVATMALTACSTTNEMTLAPNVVRLDTQARGLIATSGAGASTLKRAAEITVRRGYTHFRLQDAATSSGSSLAGVYANSNGWGSTSFNGSSANTTFGGSTTYTPIRTPTASIGVTVVMFKAGEPGARGAFEAAEVIKKNGKI